MKKYIVLITNRHFYEDRHWGFFDTLKEAKEWIGQDADYSEYDFEVREVSPIIYTTKKES